MSAFKLIAAEKANHPIDLLCRVLGVSRSGFYAWQTRAPSDRALSDVWLTERIREIHEANAASMARPGCMPSCVSGRKSGLGASASSG